MAAVECKEKQKSVQKLANVTSVECKKKQKFGAKLSKCIILRTQKKSKCKSQANAKGSKQKPANVLANKHWNMHLQLQRPRIQVFGNRGFCHTEPSKYLGSMRAWKTLFNKLDQLEALQCRNKLNNKKTHKKGKHVVLGCATESKVFYLSC